MYGVVWNGADLVDIVGNEGRDKDIPYEGTFLFKEINH
jgi:hypothetical protein